MLIDEDRIIVAIASRVTEMGERVGALDFGDRVEVDISVPAVMPDPLRSIPLRVFESIVSGILARVPATVLLVGHRVDRHGDNVTIRMLFEKPPAPTAEDFQCDDPPSETAQP